MRVLSVHSPLVRAPQRAAEIRPSDGTAANTVYQHRKGTFYEAIVSGDIMVASLQSAAVAERIVEMIHAHYAEPVTLRRLAVATGLHPNYIALAFRERMGVSVRTYLTRYRLERAAGLIASGVKIEAVSLCVGFRSKTTLYRQFKRYFGVTPEEYRHSPGGRDPSAPARV